MVNSLRINGAEYVAVNTAAEVANTSAAYVVRLAQGRWIDAATVHGQWYINLDSLYEFLATAEQDAYRQVKERDRRVKAAATITRLRAQQVIAPGDDWVVLGQSAVVVACGLLVGLLAATAWQAELKWADLQAGVMQTSLSVVDGVIAEPVPAPSAGGDVPVTMTRSSVTVVNYNPPVWPSLLAAIKNLFQ